MAQRTPTGTTGSMIVDLVTVRADVEQLLAEYAERIDAGDFEGVAELLAAARLVTEDGSVLASGRDEILRFYEQTTRRHLDGTPRTHHVITNCRVAPADLDEGAVGSAPSVDGAPPGGHRAGESPSSSTAERTPTRVVARSYFTVFQATDELALQPIIAGRYRDVFERRGDGAWCFVERCMQPVLLGDLRHHLAFDPSSLRPQPGTGHGPGVA
jgi:hypothetical protein